jgi:transcriptional regulator with XRE-family HTH domain
MIRSKLTSDMKTMGQRIRELRDEKDLSLRGLAKKLGGLSAAFLSDVELGRRHPSAKVLNEMARVLDTTVDELKSYDTRSSIEDLRRLAAQDPRFRLAFRLVRDKRVTPEDLIKLANRKPDRNQ